jgi:hypothetical protein
MATRTTRSKTPAKSDVQVTPEEGKIENATAKAKPETVADPKSPVNIELSVSEEPQKPAPAAAPEKIQTDVRERLAKKSLDENIFVPTNPAALEKAAAQVAEENGFNLNRGTSIGARLIARAQKRV